MTFQQLHINGVWLITPRKFGDERGYFMETFRLQDFVEHIGPVNFVQENESFSTRGVLRGLHFQRGDHSQAKLVRVSSGRVVDYAVDLRPESPTYGRYIGVELSGENACQLFIPRGFAHGFVVLSDEVRFHYKVDNYYAPESEMTLRFDDIEIGIDWPIEPEEMVLSPKDLGGLSFSEIKRLKCF